MPKSSGSQPSPDSLRQVAGFLRQADKLVREHSYDLALQQIAKARVRDPHNSYAEAYEQRVKLLLSAAERKEKLSLSEQNLATVPAAFTKHFERISGSVTSKALRFSGSPLDDPSAGVHSDADDVHAHDDEFARHSDTDAVFFKCLQRAHALAMKGDVSSALHEIDSVFALDPAMARLHELELHLLQERSKSASVQLSNPNPAPEPSEKKGFYGSKGGAEDESGAQRSTDEEWTTRKRGGWAETPFAEIERELHDIREFQGKLHRWMAEQELISRKRQLEEKKKKTEQQVQDALQLLGNREYAAALKLVTDGLSEDPSNRSLLVCEHTILELLSEAAQGTRMDISELSSSEDIFPTGRTPETADTKGQILAHLDHARKHLDTDRIAEALTEVSMALLTMDLVHGQKSVHPEGRKIHGGTHTMKKRDDEEAGTGMTPLDDAVVHSSNVAGPQVKPLNFHDRPGLTITQRLCKILDLLVGGEFQQARQEIRLAQSAGAATEDLRLLDASLEGLLRNPESLSHLSELHGEYEDVLEQVRALILRYSYHNVVEGIDLALERFPGSKRLLKRKDEALGTLDDLFPTVNGVNPTTETNKGKEPTSMSTKRRSRRTVIDQFGLDFRDETESFNLEGILSEQERRL